MLVRCGESPVAGESVEIHATTAVLQAETDEHGIARWDDPPTGVVIVRSARGGEGAIRIEAHQNNRLELILSSGVRVDGRVIDTSGQPVPDATICLARPVTA